MCVEAGTFSILHPSRRILTIGVVALTAALFLAMAVVRGEAQTTLDGPECSQTALDPVENRFKMKPREYREQAHRLFYRCHRWIGEAEDVPSKFRANLDFPDDESGFVPLANLPWQTIDPLESSEAYLDAMLDYAMSSCGGNHVDWDGVRCGWYHAPWMHNLREPMYGLTRERSSRPGELHPAQTVATQNWAVSLYNDRAALGLHKIWADPANPQTKDFADANKEPHMTGFPEGSFSVKLLFSLATPEQVPYLRYAKTWQIHDGNEFRTARLMQVDVLVKDSRVNAFTGWLMGSFLYNGAIETSPRCDQTSNDVEACEQSRWRDRLVPIGLQWGNDPQMYEAADAADDLPNTRVLFAEGTLPEPQEHWLNGEIGQMFSPLRLSSGHPPYLGFHGRMNGPVDNHRSTCLACHSRAVDFGRYEEDALRLVPFVAFADPLSPSYPEPDLAELKRFFRNLKPGEPFLEGAANLDYSLQAAVGLAHYRRWVETLQLHPDEKKKTYVELNYVPPDAVEQPLTFATWNIANLHHQTGVALRPGAPKRTDADFEWLRLMAASLDADVIALQEIGSPAALARVLPAREYHLVMSDRYAPGDELRSPMVRDIYTAFAFRRSVFPKVPKVETVSALALEKIQVDENAVLQDGGSARAGMAVEFTFGDKTYAILNVHLKSGCDNGPIWEDESDLPGDGIRFKHKVFACRTLVAQAELIENWQEIQYAKGNRVVMLGDFNRRLNWIDRNDPNKRDEIWMDLNDANPVKVFRKGPADVLECWVDHEKGLAQTIDFIIAESEAMSVNEAASIQKIDYATIGLPPGDYTGDNYYRISDHCPVVVTLQPG